MSEPYTWGPSQSWEELLLGLVRFNSVRSSGCWKNISLDKRGILMGSAQLPCDPLSNTAIPGDVTTQNCRTISCVIVQDPRLGCGWCLMIPKNIHLPRSGVGCRCAISYRHVERMSLIIVVGYSYHSHGDTWPLSACSCTHMLNGRVRAFWNYSTKQKTRGKNTKLHFHLYRLSLHINKLRRKKKRSPRDAISSQSSNE